ncbi:unnamed protein product, partial [Rotaria sp. Silwood2]
LKTEILDWLRSDVDDIDMGSTTTTFACASTYWNSKNMLAHLCVENYLQYNKMKAYGPTFFDPTSPLRSLLEIMK